MTLPSLSTLCCIGWKKLWLKNFLPVPEQPANIITNTQNRTPINIVFIVIFLRLTYTLKSVKLKEFVITNYLYGLLTLCPIVMGLKSAIMIRVFYVFKLKPTVDDGNSQAHCVKMLLWTVKQFEQLFIALTPTRELVYSPMQGGHISTLQTYCRRWLLFLIHSFTNDTSNGIHSRLALATSLCQDSYGDNSLIVIWWFVYLCTVGRGCQK